MAQTPVAATPTPSGQPKKRSTGLIASLVGIVVVVAAVGGYFLLAGGGEAVDVTFTLTLSDSGASGGWAIYNGTVKNDTLVVHLNDRVKVTVTNVGDAPHNFGIHDMMGMEPFPDAEIDTLLTTGQSASATFTADQAGTFMYVCMVAGHDDLGMRGLFIVLPS